MMVPDDDDNDRPEAEDWANKRTSPIIASYDEMFAQGRR